MRMGHKVLLMTIAMALMMAATGCCSDKDRGFVQKEWSTTLRELGIVPVFPPREDVMAGDVYAYSFNPEAPETRRIMETRWSDLKDDASRKIKLQIGMSPRLGRLDLSKALSEEYGQTLSAPRTSKDYESILRHPDYLVIDSAINDAETALAEKTRALAQAKEAKAAVDEQLKQHLRLQEDAKTALDRANEDLTADKENADKKLAVAQAIQNKREMDDKVTALRRKQQDTDGQLQGLQNSLEPAIAAQTAKLASLKEVRETLLATRTQAVYPQPRDEQRNLFTGKHLGWFFPDPDDGVNSRVNRLRLVAFPEFSTTSYTQSDISAMIPIEALLLGLNISSSNLEQISVKIPAAESYGISLARLVNEVADENRSNCCPKWCLIFEQVCLSCLQDKNKCKASWGFKTTPAMKQILAAARFQTHNGGSDDEASDKVYFRFISEVYYARAMDITLFASSTFGGRLRAEVPGTALPGSLLSGNAPAAMRASGQDAPEMARSLQAMESQLGKTMAVPGGAIQFVSYSDRSIGLRRIFDRPVAVGFRCVVVEWDKQREAITQVVIGDSSTPSKVNRLPEQ